jgi:adenylosuccinate lyase
LNFTIGDIVKIFNAAGFTSLDEAIAGFSVMALVNKRLRLENSKLKTQAAQQQKIAEAMAASNPEIDSINQQLNTIDQQIAQLQGL